MLNAKEALKGMCVHEMIVQKETNAPHLCVKKASENAIESTVEILEETKNEMSQSLEVTEKSSSK